MLVGDISSRAAADADWPRLHQVGHDADIWLTPMPKKRFTSAERESVSAVSMLKPDSLYVDPKKWTPARTALLKHRQLSGSGTHLRASGIKKQPLRHGDRRQKLARQGSPLLEPLLPFPCCASTCQPGSPECKPQPKVAPGDGCDKSLAWWFTDEPWKPAKPSGKPAKKPKPVMVSDLPNLCRRVERAGAELYRRRHLRRKNRAFRAACPSSAITGLDAH